MAQVQCHFCGAGFRLDEPVGREATCDSCGRDLRACRQCRHYDPRYNNSCRETMADPVEDKERRNFCEYFSFSREPFVPVGTQKDRAGEARAKLAGLFKQPPGKTSEGPSDPRAKLDALFKKERPEE